MTESINGLPHIEIYHRDHVSCRMVSADVHKHGEGEEVVIVECACGLLHSRTVTSKRLNELYRNGWSLSFVVYDRIPARPNPPGRIYVSHEAVAVEIPYTLSGNTSFDDCTGDSPWDKTEAQQLAERDRDAANLITGTAAARVAMSVYTSAQREDDFAAGPTPLTSAERAIASAEWSRQLREKVAASREAERVQVRVDLQREGDG